MRRVRWWCLLAALLAGCLNYKIKVTMLVRPDGSFEREISIRCSKNVQRKQDGELTEEPPTWSSFDEPTEPYALTGSHAEGFVARAKFEAGDRPSGIRRRLYEDREETIEGRVRVDVTDVVIGRLYTYRETIALGCDAVRFRQELRRWLDLGARLYVEALRREMPQADFDPVLDNARKRIVPRLEASLLIVRDQLDRLTRQFRSRPELLAPTDPGAVLALPEVRLILAELEKYGVRRDPNQPLPAEVENLLNDNAWIVEPTLVREFLMPLRGVTDEERAELVRKITENEIELDTEAAFEVLEPDKAKRTAIENEAEEFGVATLGAWVMQGLFDHHGLTFLVRMPGELLATNGELGEHPATVWHFGDEHLWFSDPQLHAVSFDSENDPPSDGWSLTRLTELRDAIRKLDDKRRARLPALLAKARDMGWDSVLEKETEDEDLETALERMRDALAHPQDREGEGVED